MSSGKGERRIANPVTKDELIAVFIGLASGEKDAVGAVASLAAIAIQRLVAERASRYATAAKTSSRCSHTSDRIRVEAARFAAWPSSMQSKQSKQVRV